MSENIDELRSMLVSFRVSELQMLLGFAGRNKTGRKTELQQRAIELLYVRSHTIHQKIKEIYKSIQYVPVRQNAGLNVTPLSQNSPVGDTNNSLSNNMPQPGSGSVPRPTASVHPYSVDTRLSARPTPMYNQNMYQHYQQPPQQYQSKPNMMQGNTGYPVHPDVKFRRLPFYDIIDDLLKPSSLLPQNNTRIQEGTFFFHLTPQQATDIASSRDIRHGTKNAYTKQVQMRFCLLETSCEQEDYFPPSIVVKVNNKLCPLPNPIPTNKPGVEPKRPPRPVNITSMIKLSPTVANTIHVSWAADYGRGYAISVALVHKRTSSDLLQRLKNRGAKHSDHTRGLIKEKLNEDADSEIATTSLRVSLMCPLGKMRMTTPCRAITCNHLQCFDAYLFLQMNELKPTWNCPVCDKPAVYDNLVIDGYFQEVLNSSQLPSEVNEIQLHKDGSWSVQAAEKKPPPKASVNKVTCVDIDDSIEIIGDDVEVVTSPSSTTNTTIEKPKEEPMPVAPTVAAPKKDKTIVDLTLSDSDDDDEPLAKRRATNPKPDSTIKFSDTTSISSSSNQSRVTTTPGPSSVSSSGYPASPGIITLDSPSPPRSPHMSSNQTTQQPSSCMMAPTNGNMTQQQAMFSPGGSMPILDLDSDANNGGIPYY